MIIVRKNRIEYKVFVNYEEMNNAIVNDKVKYNKLDEIENIEISGEIVPALKCEIGEYIMLKNGYYLPITRISRNKRISNRQQFLSSTTLHLVLNHNLVVIISLDGKIKFREVEFIRERKNEYRISPKDRMIISLLKEGVDIVSAIKLVFGAINNGEILKKINKYVSNQLFVKHISEIVMNLNMIFDKNGLNQQRFAEYVKNILEDEKSPAPLKKYALEILYEIVKQNDIEKVKLGNNSVTNINKQIEELSKSINN